MKFSVNVIKKNWNIEIKLVWIGHNLAKPKSRAR